MSQPRHAKRVTVIAEQDDGSSWTWVLSDLTEATVKVDTSVSDGKSWDERAVPAPATADAHFVGTVEAGGYVTYPDETPESVWAAWQALRDWLRYHNEYTVKVDPWGIYGTVTVDVSLAGRPVYSDMGTRFSKRLTNALDAARRDHAGRMVSRG